MEKAKQQKQFKADEVLSAAYIFKQSRASQFKTAKRAWVVQPDGSISSPWELEFSKKFG